MKKPPTVPREPELLSYKLEYTPDLRCEKQTDLVPVCHRCKSCILSWRIFSTREWFTRASHITQRQFLVGIIKRFKNQDLLMYAWNLLRSVANSKDFTYSRSCVSSSFVPSSTLDRALDPQKLEQAMASLWKWFLNAGFWTKANYTLLLLQMCDSQLVLIAASLIRILLSQKKTKKVKAAEEKAKDEELPVEDQERPNSEVLTHLTTDSTDVPSVFDSAFASEKNKLFGPLHVQRVWPTDLDEVSESSFGTEDAITSHSTAPNVTTESTTPKKTPVDINRFKDFIRCLPIHLSKRILGMLDHKSLSRCVYVSPYWAFLVKQIRKDLASRRALHNEVVFFQASCPKRAAASYARIVKVAIPQITEDGDIVPVGSRTKLQVKEFEHLQKAYHGQMTATVKLEERNVFCSSYNVRILIDKLDPNRVIHYSGGKLMAIGSADRKIHFLNVDMVKEVPPLIRGHAGSIRALYLNEQKGFILSGSFDLSIRMWSILTGTCVKIFNGHSGSITCLDLYKTKFVSGAKDCTAKMWDLETGKCLKTFKHKGIVWAAKMNDTHVVSACEKGEVKVWHVGTFILIKTLEGHLGPVKCLSFDEWHLVTGSNDGYILGWSMLGNHKRCLMAFRHPMEVLYLGFLYLRVISGCADGKIRIFNFLTGTCLRIMRANSRGDPVASICIVENRLLINAQGSVVLFQFEEVTWEYTSTSERVTHKKDHSKFDETPLRIKPDPHSHTERQKRAKKKNWKLYKTEEIQNETMLSYYITREFTRGSKAAPVLHYEMVKEPPPGTSPDMRKNVVRLDSKASDRQRLSSLANIKGQKTDSDAESISTLKGSSDDESGYESPAPVSPLRGQIPEAFVNYVKKKQSLGPVANDQLLLTVSTIQHAYKADRVSVNMAYNMKIKDAWGPIHPHKEPYKKILAPQIPKQQKIDPSTQLKQLKAAAGTPGIERISTPYETKTLQLNLKNSLLGDSVQSFIPTPTLTRSKSCSSLSGEKKAYTTQAKIPSPPPGGKQVIGYFTSSNESIKVPRMKIAQPDTEVISRRPKLFFAHTPNPYRLNTGFRLLTTQQMKEYEEAKVSEYQAKKTEVIANRQKECKNAWLRKIKGLPIDDFTKEGKISAPELGQNVFI